MIDKDMLVCKVLEVKPEAKEVFMEFGLHCFNCPMARMESLEDASASHGIDLDALLTALNKK